MFRFINTFVASCEELKEKTKLQSTLIVSPNDNDGISKMKNEKKVKVEDPFECVNPACADKMSFFKQAMQMEMKNKKEKTLTTPNDKQGSVQNQNQEEIQDESKESKDVELECPLDRAELGRSTWNFLHTLAIYYPDTPSKEEESSAKQLIEALAVLYPCKYCAGEFQENMKESPPRTGSREELSKWLCEQHNIVNERLDKPQFECNIESLDKRWKTGVPGCWNYQIKDKLHDDE